MNNYHFTWELTFEAETLEDAVEQLEGTVRDPGNTATCYTVKMNGKEVEGFVDLQEEGKPLYVGKIRDIR